MSKVNYMDEIKRIESVLEELDNGNVPREQQTAVSRLKVMLQGLEQTADEMASYIRGDWDAESLNVMQMINNDAFATGNYVTYANNLSKLLRSERAMLICASQTPDEKAYFISEYYKHKKAKEGYSYKKVR